MGGKILIQVKYSTDLRKVWLGKVSDGNYVVRHCPSPITAIVYTNYLSPPTLPTLPNLAYLHWSAKRCSLEF